jgi:twitching motility protein PilI
MSQADARQLLSLLHGLEQRSRKNAIGLPRQNEVHESWEGVMFSVSGLHLVAPLGELIEILNYPASVTPVPGTQPWVRGVANVRGILLPIVDLQQFLGGAPTITGRRSRVLVARQEGARVGLLVGEVFGMRHFLEENRGRAPAFDDRVSDFVGSVFEEGRESWPVFSVTALLKDREFLVAAA